MIFSTTIQDFRKSALLAQQNGVALVLRADGIYIYHVLLNPHGQKYAAYKYLAWEEYHLRRQENVLTETVKAAIRETNEAYIRAGVAQRPDPEPSTALVPVEPASA